ncbi:MAG: hypothetical protein KKB37_02730, partial [Alphaproteobacteria bacterium]|nr:hypothetical protein [Alphaproteobacteria bacterium]
MTRLTMSVWAAALLAVTLPHSAVAVQINTGGESGAYHDTFCPSLTKQLDLLGKPSECLVSDGTGENLRRVARNPDEFGYGQLDAFALEADRFGGPGAFDLVRVDDVRECVFAVTRNRDYTNFGEIAVNADRLRFVLPPAASGSARTFAYLQKIDPEGLGRARNVINAVDTNEAIREALADENSVTFFVQFPDPANDRFRQIRNLKGHIVPVVDGLLLRQKIDGRSVYFAQETPISQLEWLNIGARVVTVCTPLVLFTGAANRVTGADRRAEHRQTVLNIRAMRREELVPPASPVAQIVARTRELSTRARY